MEIFNRIHIYKEKLTFSFLLIFTYMLINVPLHIRYSGYLSDWIGISGKFYTISKIPLILGISILYIYLLNNITIKLIFRVGLTYLVYILFSLLLLITREVNNPNFDITKLDINKIFNGFGIVIIFFVTLSAYILKKIYLENFKKIKFIENSKYPRILEVGILSILIPTFTEFVINFTMTDYLLSNENSIFNIFQSILSSVCVYFIIAVILQKIVSNTIRALKNNRPNLSLVLLLSFTLSVVLNYFIQLSVKQNVQYYELYIFPGATTYQVSFFTGLFFFIYLIFNRFLFIFLIEILVIVGLSIANYLKVSMRSEPLLISDFIWLTNPKLLASFVELKTLIIFFSFLLSMVLIYYVTRNKILPGEITTSWVIRGIFSGIVLTFFIVTISVFRSIENKKVSVNLPILTTLINDNEIDWMGFETTASFKSLAYVWTKQLTEKIMEQPSEYSEERIAEIVDKYTNRAAEINQSRNKNISEQTIVYILSESLSNPNRIPTVRVSENVLKNIDNIKQNTTSGLMLSTAYGGGTANIEFGTLTGLPYQYLSPSISTIYTQVAPNMEFLPGLSNNFKEENKYVIHPSNAQNYNRLNIYRQWGYGTSIFLSGSSQKFDNLRYLGSSVSDKTVFQTILDNMDEESQFFSVITMQNHAPWTYSQPESIFIDSSEFDDTTISTLNNYSRMLYATDIQVKSFLEELEKFEKDITVVFYGDHLPGIYPDSIFSTDPNSKFNTDYFIWSNKNGIKLDYPNISPNDFIPLILEHTNSKVSPYEALLTDAVGLNNNIIGDKIKDRSILEQELSLIMYDLVLGNGYAYRDNFYHLIN